MSDQWKEIIIFVLGIIVGGGAWYGNAPGRNGFWLVPLLAAALFVAILLNAIK